MVVVGPVCYWPQRRTGGEGVGAGEEGHQRYEAAVAASVDSDLLGVDALCCG